MMPADKIKRLSGDAARLLLALLTCEHPATIVTLPHVIERAGLVQTEYNTHGKNRYARAYQQLSDLGFLTLQDSSIRVLLELVTVGSSVKITSHDLPKSGKGDTDV